MTLRICYLYQIYPTLIVTMSHCYTRGPFQTPRNPKRPQPMGHRNNTVASLACGCVAVATRAPQPSRHNRHSDCSPSGSNYPYISKECWPLCEPRFILFKSPAASSVRQTSHIFHTDLQRDGDRASGSPFTREVVQKHPVPLSYFLFYTQTQRLRVQ